MKLTPPQSLLLARLDYNPETGIIKHRITSRRAIAGIEAGKLTRQGYRVIGVNGNQHLAHRLAWTMHYGERLPSNVIVDHRDGDRLNNSIRNLRIADHAQNTVNSRPTGPHKKGATLLPGGRWMAQGGPFGTNRYLGLFDTEDEANAAYAAAMTLHYGEFSRSA